MPVLAAPEQLIRLTDARYGDGFSTLIDGVDAVSVAQGIFDQDGSITSIEGLSILFVSWGQFTDHDLSLTRDNTGEFVQVPGLSGPLDRSAFDPATGTTDPRQQVNEITAEMDASQIYGSTSDRTEALRSFEGGRLATSGDGLMPLADPGDEMAGNNDPDSPVFLAGDIRANENTGLTLLHTLFVREHNYWADRLAADNPTWTDEQLFQAARSIIEVELQHITYTEWLPHLIGDATDTVTPTSTSGQIATEFSTAAFRFGHTMVATEIPDLAKDGEEVQMLSVRDQFFNVDVLRDSGIDGLLRGQAATLAQDLDTKVIDDLNFFLVLGNGASGFSLPALNIMRGRDHGLDSYLNTRAAVVGDIDPSAIDPADFSIITSDVSLQMELSEAYGTVDQVDLWVGGLAEDAIPGTQMGVTFTAIIADQFVRTRLADTSFGGFDPLLSQDIIDEVTGTKLSDIIVRNTDTKALQLDPFKAMTRSAGTEGADRMAGHTSADLMMGWAGNDSLRAGSGDDEAHGGDGNDALRGQMGDDAMFGDAGHDFLSGSHGKDHLDGGAGDDILRGGRDDDVVLGGAGNDRMRGNDGDDRLDGGGGYDKIVGDAGADIFIFAAGNQVDDICDFRVGEDRVDLTGTSITRFADLSALAEQGRNRLTFEIDDDTLILRKVLLGDLSADDFIFG